MHYLKAFLFASAFGVVIFVSTASKVDARPRIATQTIERDKGSVRSEARLATRRGDAIRTIDLNANLEARTATKNVSRTGAQGRRSTYSRSVQGRDNGYDAASTYRGFQGRTAQRSQSVTYEEGSFNRSSFAELRTGSSVNASTNATRTDGGFTGNRAFETSGGRGAQVSSSAMRFDGGGGTVTRQVTNGQGETVATKSTTIKDGAKTTVVTGRDGKGHTPPVQGSD